MDDNVVRLPEGYGQSVTVDLECKVVEVIEDASTRLERHVSRLKDLDIRLPEEVTPAMVDEIKDRIGLRFYVAQILTEKSFYGKISSFILSGAAGLGKSYTVTHSLLKEDPSAINHHIHKGYMLATGLYKLLYRFREPGMVLVIDDCDRIYNDTTALNILKGALDSTPERWIAWGTQAKLRDDDPDSPYYGEDIPHRFQYEGACIFISNIDFDAWISKGTNIAPHLRALLSRSLYVDTTINSNIDRIVRIQMALEEGMLSDLSNDELMDVMNWLWDNYRSLREITLREAMKVAELRRSMPDEWEAVAEITMKRAIY